MASTPEKIRAAMLRVEQKYDANRRHLARLEWSLKNAEALENLAGWVGFYCVSRSGSVSQKCVFPLGKNTGRYVADPAFTIHHDCAKNQIVLRGATEHVATIPFGTAGAEKIWGYTCHIGFFPTRREAKDFVRAVENPPEPQK